MSENIFDDFEEQNQEPDFLDFNQIHKGILNKPILERVRVNNISNEIALSTPFGKRSRFYKPIYIKENIDFQKLAKLILKKEDVVFNWKDYIGHKTVTIKHRAISESGGKFDRLTGIDTTYTTTETVETEIPLIENKIIGERELDLQGVINKEINIVNIKEDNEKDLTNGLEFEFDYKRRLAKYKLHYYYVNKERVTEAKNKNNIAFTISSSNYSDFEAVFKLVKLRYRNTNFEDKITTAFKNAINQVNKLPDKVVVKDDDDEKEEKYEYNDTKFFILRWLYSNIPSFVAKQLDFNKTLIDVFKLNNWDASNMVTFDTTKPITTILSRLNPVTVYNYFNNNPQSIIDLLKEFDDDALTEHFCQYLTAITLRLKGEDAIKDARKFNIGENTHIESNILFGDPEGRVELVNELQLPIIPVAGMGLINLFTDDVEINNPKKQSNIFHPLDLIYISHYDTELQEEIKIPSIALYAKYLGDKSEWADVLTATFAVIDVVSIVFSGGALAVGLRGIARVFAIIDITISTVNLAILSPGVKKALNKTEAGKWFVAHWPLISFSVSFGMISVYLAKGIIKYGSQVKTQLKNGDDVVKSIDELIEESRKIADEVGKTKVLDKNGIKLSNANFSRNLKSSLKVKEVVQKTNDIKLLYKEAKTANQELRKITEDFALITNGKAETRPQKINNGLKSIERATQKIKADYNGDASKLVDIAGSKVVYNTVNELYEALLKLNKEIEILKFKDRLLEPLPSGYRDILMNARMKNGHIVEIRLHLKAIDEVSSFEHDIYKKIRSIEAKAKIENRKLTIKEFEYISKLRTETKQIFENAYKKTLN